MRVLMVGLVTAFMLPGVAPTDAAVEFVTNGTFEGGAPLAVPPLSGPLDVWQDFIPNGWTRVETFTGGVVENSVIVPNAVNGPTFPGAVAIEFTRSQGGVSGDRTSIIQPLNIPVADYSSLTLNIDVNVVGHNLAAGGWVAPAFEWPAFVRVSYLDDTNTAQIWRHGWYLNQPGDVVTPPAGSWPNSPINDPGAGLITFYNDTMVPFGAWVPNTFNLLNELPQAKTITGIEVGGSGWDFGSLIDNLSVQGVLIPEPSTFLIWSLGLLGLIGWRRRRSK